jgi:site-specific recombinase XerD
MGGSRYPENKSPFRAELDVRDERFAQLREDFLLNYGYNTARAYWGDLEHLKDWCQERGLDVLDLPEQELREYLSWMSARGYSGSTTRRRETTYKLFKAHVAKPHGEVNS